MSDRTGVALITLSDVERMASAFAKSGLFGMKTPEQALALMLIAQAEGLHPASAIQQFSIINGTPARKSWSMLERFQQAGGSVQWQERTDERVAATFSHPQGGTVLIEWDMKRAAQAGLAGKQNWKNYPRQMLTARVISEGVRTVYPGATSGFYTPEEAGDFTTDARPEKRGKQTVIPPEPAAPAAEPFDLAADAEPAVDYAFHWPAPTDSAEIWKAAAKRALQVVREIQSAEEVYRWQEANINGLKMLHVASEKLYNWLGAEMAVYVTTLPVPAEAQG